MKLIFYCHLCCNNNWNRKIEFLTMRKNNNNKKITEIYSAASLLPCVYGTQRASLCVRVRITLPAYPRRKHRKTTKAQSPKEKQKETNQSK